VADDYTPSMDELKFLRRGGWSPDSIPGRNADAEFDRALAAPVRTVTSVGGGGVTEVSRIDCLTCGTNDVIARHMQNCTPAPREASTVTVEQAWDECIRAVEWAQQNGTDPLAYVYANNPYRAARIAETSTKTEED
jgi:hypothetical protein